MAKLRPAGSQPSQRASTSSPVPASILALIERLGAASTVLGRAHRVESERYEKRHIRVGLPAAVLAAIVSTTVFAALQEAAHGGWPKVALVIVSLAATGLTTAATFLKLQEKAEAHRQGAAEYQSIARAAQSVSVRATAGAMNPPQVLRSLDGITQRLDAIAERVPAPALVTVTREARAAGVDLHDVATRTVLGAFPSREAADQLVKPVAAAAQLNALLSAGVVTISIDWSREGDAKEAEPTAEEESPEPQDRAPDAADATADDTSPPKPAKPNGDDPPAR